MGITELFLSLTHVKQLPHVPIGVLECPAIHPRLILGWHRFAAAGIERLVYYRIDLLTAVSG